MLTSAQIIAHFKLEPLPIEGGLFRQTYHSKIRLPKDALPGHYPEDKPAGVAIIYLLSSDDDSFSALHRLPTDEIYHFYLGDPVILLLLYPDGTSARITLGQDILNGQHVQFVVPAGVWQGSFVQPGGEFALMGTTMAPGYTDSDYVGGERAALIGQYPDEAKMITRLTRSSA